MKMFKQILHSPHLSLFAGVVLLLTAGYETITTFETFSLGAHHGILLYSLIHIAKAIPELKEGLGQIESIIE
jgi:hypothetical protein